MDLWSLIARGIVLLTAMPVHECAHGFVASRLGDPTPDEQGRLTLNPFAHLSLFGSLMLIVVGFGWAKPVQVDPRNFKNPKRGMALTALAGPVSNVLMALVAMVLYKVLVFQVELYRTLVGQYILEILGFVVTINLMLAMFNLLPIPPLDGSKIFNAILPDNYYAMVLRYERYIMVVLFALLWSGVLDTPLYAMNSAALSFLDWITYPLGRL